MPKRPAWYKRLEPFGDDYLAMNRAINERLEAMSDDELQQIAEDATMPNQTNCGWHIYRVAQLIKAEAQSTEAQ